MKTKQWSLKNMSWRNRNSPCSSKVINNFLLISLTFNCVSLERKTNPDNSPVSDKDFRKHGGRLIKPATPGNFSRAMRGMKKTFPLLSHNWKKASFVQKANVFCSFCELQRARGSGSYKAQDTGSGNQFIVLSVVRNKMLPSEREVK